MRQLGLGSWNIECSYSRAHDIGEGTHGSINWDSPHLRARIRLLDPVDYIEGALVPYDAERTLVHELLHLRFDYVIPESDTPAYASFEQGINALAGMLVDWSREDEFADDDAADTTDSAG